MDIYHLKAFFQTLLNFDRDDEETILQCQGWRNKIDSPATYTATNVRTDHADFDALSANHQAGIKLQKADARNYYAEGKRTLRMKPFVDVFQQGKWIVPRTLLEFEFYLNAAALFMNGEANPPNEAARVSPEVIKLAFYLCLVTFNPSVHNELMLTMYKTPAKYPMIYTEMRQFPLDNGAISKEINNPFNGKVPQRVILAFYKP